MSITCCWTGEFERITVTWKKNQTTVKREMFSLKKRSQFFLYKKTSDCSNLTLTNSTREDSGRYTCKVSVEIPFLYVSEGNGTVITVMARDDTDSTTAGGRCQNISCLTYKHTAAICLIPGMIRTRFIMNEISPFRNRDIQHVNPFSLKHCW